MSVYQFSHSSSFPADRQFPPAAEEKLIAEEEKHILENGISPRALWKAAAVTFATGLVLYLAISAPPRFSSPPPPAPIKFLQR